MTLKIINIVIQLPMNTHFTHKLEEKMIEELIATYLKFIQAKADIYWKKDSSLNIPREKRKSYFKSLDSDDILAENRVLNALSISAFDVIRLQRILSYMV